MPPPALRRTGRIVPIRGKAPPRCARSRCSPRAVSPPACPPSVGGLIERYSELAPEVEIIGYRHGYQGLLSGDILPVTPAVRARARLLHEFGGSPLGNSRVKLTNTKDLIKRGLITEGQDPLQVAAERLTADGVDVLHTIGGDDTATTAADLARYLKDNGYDLTVVGLPKTIDNDIVPIKHSLGAWTAAEQGAAVRPQHRRRAQRERPDADRARDHGPALRLADRGHRRRLRPLARLPALAAGVRAVPRRLGHARDLPAGGRRSTWRPRPTGSRP